MKKFLTLLATVMLACGLSAKPERPEREGGKKGGPPEGRPSREEVMKKFDKDGDGKLSEDEKAELRKAMANRGGRPGGRRPPPRATRPSARRRGACAERVACRASPRGATIPRR